MATSGSNKVTANISIESNCSECEKGKSVINTETFKCINCDAIFCEQCWRAHELKTKHHNHTQKPTKQDGTSSGSSNKENDCSDSQTSLPDIKLAKCSTHEKQLILYCGFHDEICCLMCAFDSHSGSECKPSVDLIKDVAYTDKAESYYKKVQEDMSTLLSSFESQENDVKSRRSKLSVSKQECTDSIDYIANKAVGHIKTLQEASIAELNKVYGNCLEELTNKLDDFSKHKKELHDLKILFETLKSDSNEEAFIQMKMHKEDLKIYSDKAKSSSDTMKCNIRFIADNVWIQEVCSTEKLGECSISEGLDDDQRENGHPEKADGNDCTGFEIDKKQQSSDHTGSQNSDKTTIKIENHNQSKSANVETEEKGHNDTDTPSKTGSETNDGQTCVSLASEAKRSDSKEHTSTLTKSCIERTVKDIVEIKRGSIVDFEADVIVNSVKHDFTLDAGNLSRAIYEKAGSGMQKELTKNNPSGLKMWEVVSSNQHGLTNCKMVLHCLPKGYKTNDDIQKLRKLLNVCLCKVSEIGYTSIAIPAIGTGVLEYPKPAVANAMFEEVANYLKTSTKKLSIQKIIFVVYDKDEKAIEAFQNVSKEYGY